MKILSKSEKNKNRRKFRFNLGLIAVSLIAAVILYGGSVLLYAPGIEEMSVSMNASLVPALPEYQEIQLYERDGISYLLIHGYEMLLVNKTHSVPPGYGNGLAPEARAAYDAMAAAAAQTGRPIWIYSGYRSYQTQANLFASNVSKYGSEEKANQICARAGQSEHQVGLAVDLAGSEGILSDGSPSFLWVSAHCAEYGFILRYPEGKTWATGYIYEPWHFRYVGVELAGILTASGLSVEEYAGLVTQPNE